MLQFDRIAALTDCLDSSDLTPDMQGMYLSIMVIEIEGYLESRMLDGITRRTLESVLNRSKRLIERIREEG